MDKLMVGAVALALVSTQAWAADPGACWATYNKAKNAAKGDEAKIEKADKAYDMCMASAKPVCIKGGVRIGMSADQVKCGGWGKPDQVNRTTTIHGVREQWVYGTRGYLYFDDGVLTAVQN
jgi:hypothetical protein